MSISPADIEILYQHPRATQLFGRQRMTVCFTDGEAMTGRAKSDRCLAVEHLEIVATGQDHLVSHIYLGDIPHDANADSRPRN